MRSKRISRRSFLRGVAGLSGAGLAGALVSCAPAAEPTAAPTAAPETAAEATTAATAEPTVAPAPTPMPDEPCVVRFTNYGTAAPDDHLIKQIIEDALRDEYGLNVDLQFESQGPNQDVANIRYPVQETDGAHNNDTDARRFIETPGLIMDITDIVQEYGTHLLAGIPEAAWDFLSKDGRYHAIPAMRNSVVD